MLLGRLVVEGTSSSRGSFKALLSSSLRRTTVLLWFIWMSCAFCYYGLVLMSTELFGGENKTPTPGLDDCHALATTDYMDLLWTTLAEFPGIFATIYIIERCGRKKTMAFQFLLYAGCVSLITITNEYEKLWPCDCIYEITFFQSSSPNSHFVPWSRCHRRTFPSSLCLHTGSIPNKPSFNRCWWMLVFGEIRRNVHSLCRSSAISSISGPSSCRLWAFRYLCVNCLYVPALRNSRKWFGNLNNQNITL